MVLFLSQTKVNTQFFVKKTKKNTFLFLFVFHQQSKKCYSKNDNGKVFGVYLFSHICKQYMVQALLRSPAVHWDRFLPDDTNKLSSWHCSFMSILLCYVMCWIAGTFGFFFPLVNHIFTPYYTVINDLSMQDYLYLCGREWCVIWLSVITLRANWLRLFSLFVFFLMRSSFNIDVWSAKSDLFYHCVYCLAVPRHSFGPVCSVN